MLLKKDSQVSVYKGTLNLSACRLAINILLYVRFVSNIIKCLYVLL
jgi:hypothetical protein